MNKQTFTHGLLMLALFLALVFGHTTTALALEPETDTTPPGPVTVSTFEELTAAIDEAEAGTTIGITAEIELTPGTSLGSPKKAISISRATAEGYLYFTSGDGSGSASVQNITFDGGEIPANTPFVSSGIATTFSKCSFINCFSENSPSGALSIDGGNNVLTDCTFRNNRALSGAHISISGGGSNTIENCTFSQGNSTLKGGGIVNNATCTITGSIITGNHAGQFGGGIWNSGTLTIGDTKIYYNTADQGGNDIANDQWGQLTLQDDHAALVTLFTPDSLIPNEWTVDTFTEKHGPEETVYTFYTLTFAEPKPDPEPTPTPTPDNDDDTPSYRPSGTGSSHSSAKPVTATPKAVLTCGKAVLDPTKGDYLLGYSDGLMGQENAVTRAQLAQILYRVMTPESRAAVQSQTTKFIDVQKSAWYYEAVCALEKAGVIAGSNDGKFYPDKQVTWGEMISYLYRFTDHKPVSHIITRHWAKDAINTAIDFLWIDYTDQFQPDGVVTRPEMVQFVQTVFTWANK